MQTANALLALAGDKRTTVPKYGVTAAEVAVLRFLHGEDAVFDIEIVGEVTRTHRQEIGRLSRRYGRQEGERRLSPAVEALYPGVAARVFESFEELEIPDEFYKAIERKTAKSAPAAPKPPIEERTIAEMTVNQLRAHADKIGVDLTGVTKKADIIEAIEMTAPVDTGAPDDPEEDDDGVGEINDEFTEKEENLFQ